MTSAAMTMSAPVRPRGPADVPHSRLCLDDPNSAATGPNSTIHIIQYSCGNFPPQRRWEYPTPPEYHDGNPLFNEANHQWACRLSNSADVVFEPPFDTFEDTAGYWCGCA
jgi:hypothetical protein